MLFSFIYWREYVIAEWKHQQRSDISEFVSGCASANPQNGPQKSPSKNLHVQGGCMDHLFPVELLSESLFWIRVEKIFKPTAPLGANKFNKSHDQQSAPTKENPMNMNPILFEWWGIPKFDFCIVALQNLVFTKHFSIWLYTAVEPFICML